MRDEKRAHPTHNNERKVLKSVSGQKQTDSFVIPPRMPAAGIDPSVSHHRIQDFNNR